MSTYDTYMPAENNMHRFSGSKSDFYTYSNYWHMYIQCVSLISTWQKIHGKHVLLFPCLAFCVCVQRIFGNGLSERPSSEALDWICCVSKENGKSDQPSGEEKVKNNLSTLLSLSSSLLFTSSCPPVHLYKIPSHHLQLTGFYIFLLVMTILLACNIMTSKKNALSRLF